jgi:acetyltransferase-like isoleucine patch superfamily enzyme
MIVELCKFIIRKFYFLFILKRKNILLLGNVRYNASTTFEGYNKIYKNVNICSTYIGMGTYICEGSIITNSRIGKFCSIAPFVKVILGKHPTNTFVSTHPSFFSTKKQAGFSFVKEDKFTEQNIKTSVSSYSIEIGNDVWIGYGVHILEGVKIGNGAVIGACSLVTKDIEPYTINVGVPTKKIKNRFNEEDISFLESIQWWNWGMSKLKSNNQYFFDIDSFKRNANGEL